MSFSKELAKRLLNARQILNHGIEHGTKNGELNRLFSIISLDGAVENFLYTVIAELGGELKHFKKPSFNEVFSAADEAVKTKRNKFLPLKTEIMILHQTRNEAQHNAVIPDISTIKRFIVYSSDFLAKSFELCFNTSLDKVHLADAIMDLELQKIMRQAEDKRLEKDYQPSAQSSALAFEILKKKKQKHEMWRKKLDSFVQFQISDILKGLVFQDRHRGSENALRKFLDSIVSEFEYLNDRLEVISLGANIQEYLFFRKNTPHVSLSMSGTPRFGTITHIDYSEKNCLRIFNFVYNLILSWESALQEQSENTETQ
jgi:hypothetical protein